MKKLLFLLSVLLLVGMIAPARADVTPSQIVKEYKVGDKTYCLVKRSDFYRLTRPEMNAAWEKFWESGDFLEYESNARRTLLLRDEAKLRITGISGNDELERIIRSVYTPEEIEKYAAAKTSDMRGIFLYILCDYTGKIVSIAMGGIGTDSLDNLHPSALNVEKFARLIEAIEKRWRSSSFTRRIRNRVTRFMRAIFSISSCSPIGFTNLSTSVRLRSHCLSCGSAG